MKLSGKLVIAVMTALTASIALCSVVLLTGCGGDENQGQLRDPERLIGDYLYEDMYEDMPLVIRIELQPGGACAMETRVDSESVEKMAGEWELSQETGQIHLELRAVEGDFLGPEHFHNLTVTPEGHLADGDMIYARQ